MLSVSPKAKHAHLSSSGLRMSPAFVLAIAAMASVLLSWSSHVVLAAALVTAPAGQGSASEQAPPKRKVEPTITPVGCGGAVSEQAFGTVSVGCPKVWRSDRVFSVLDGIMRDVDSMTVRALEGLDANAANQAAIDLIQNSFDLTAKFDQAAAINNQFALQKLKTARAAEVTSFNADADFRQKLIKQRNDLTLQLLDAQAKERQQAQAGVSNEEIGKTKKLEASLQDQITGINSTLNSNPPSITDIPRLPHPAPPSMTPTGPSTLLWIQCRQNLKAHWAISLSNRLSRLPSPWITSLTCCTSASLGNLP